MMPEYRFAVKQCRNFGIVHVQRPRDPTIMLVGHNPGGEGCKIRPFHFLVAGPGFPQVF